MIISRNMSSIDTMKELSVRFKQHRVASRVSQKELSEKTGVSERTISRFENGEEIGLLTFIKLMQGLELEHNLEGNIPDYTRRPSFFAEGYHPPKIARKKKNKDEWKWGDGK